MDGCMGTWMDARCEHTWQTLKCRANIRGDDYEAFSACVSCNRLHLGEEESREEGEVPLPRFGVFTPFL